MALNWSSRRQFLYYAVAALFSVILLFGAWRTFFSHAPTCSDGIQNGSELGVDCGGSCSLICAQSARAPRVLWARAFEASPSAYTAVAYVQNLNSGAIARAAHYSFQLFDADNVLVVQKDGVAEIPAAGTIPIIETNINVGNRSVARTLFAFSDEPQWYTPTTPLPTLRFSQQSLSADASRLSAMVTNDSAVDAERVAVVAVLFDADGNARAASKTVVGSLPRRSSAPVVFTWSGGVTGIVRAELTALPPL